MDQNNTANKLAKGLPHKETTSSHKIKTLLSWEAPERIYQKKGKEFWSTTLSVVFLVSVILFFAKEYFLIATIFALVFFYYVLSIKPPQNMRQQITNRGIVWGGQQFEWDNLRRFWIKKEGGQEILNVETSLNFPRRLILLLGNEDKKKVRQILEEFIPYEEVSPSFIEKSTDWLGKTFPLESKKINKK